MKPLPRSCFTLLALAVVLAPRAARGQSVADRTPNLAGGWVGAPGTVYFNFLHRFEHGAAPARKVTNFPTFLFGYSPGARILLGANGFLHVDVTGGPHCQNIAVVAFCQFESCSTRKNETERH